MNDLKSITFKYEMNLRDKTRELITEISRGNFLFIIIVITCQYVKFQFCDESWVFCACEWVDS